MGISFAKLFNYFFIKQRMHILVIGLDAVGKSTILQKLGKVEISTPTIGFNVETVDYKNSTLIALDLGSSDKKIRIS